LKLCSELDSARAEITTLTQRNAQCMSQLELSHQHALRQAELLEEAQENMTALRSKERSYAQQIEQLKQEAGIVHREHVAQLRDAEQRYVSLTELCDEAVASYEAAVTRERKKSQQMLLDVENWIRDMIAYMASLERAHIHRLMERDWKEGSRSSPWRQGSAAPQVATDAALTVALEELDSARRELTKLHSSNIPFLVATRQPLVASLISQSHHGLRLRRLLRQLFSLPSWHDMVREKNVPDDFGRVLCDVVEDVQSLLERQRRIVEDMLTPLERSGAGE
jgi:hypothetical protein